MLRSMTAYGRARRTTSLGRLLVEIQSVNRRFLEVHVSLPSGMGSLDADTRAVVAEHLHRGHVSVRINWVMNEGSQNEVHPNLVVAKQLWDAQASLAKSLGVPLSPDQAMSWLMTQNGVFEVQPNERMVEDFKESIQSLLKEALDDLIQVKDAEGFELQKDILSRLSLIESWMKEIQKLAPSAIDKYRQKLMDRLREFAEGDLTQDERVLKELVIYTDRVDVSEEITRFLHHISHFRELILNKEIASGKKCDFLIQELMRETNTCGSKSGSLEVSHLVVQIKGELERIREQVQNVE